MFSQNSYLTRSSRKNAMRHILTFVQFFEFSVEKKGFVHLLSSIFLDWNGSFFRLDSPISPLADSKHENDL
jgi:hypothetical protein